MSRSSYISYTVMIRYISQIPRLLGQHFATHFHLLSNTLRKVHIINLSHYFLQLPAPSALDSEYFIVNSKRSTVWKCRRTSKFFLNYFRISQLSWDWKRLNTTCSPTSSSYMYVWWGKRMNNWISSFQISPAYAAINTVDVRVLTLQSSTQIRTGGQNKHFEFWGLCSDVADDSVLVGSGST